MRSLPRRDAIVALACATVAGAPASAQPALTPIRVATSPVNDVVPLLYAQNAGLFRKAGLEVTLQTTANGSAAAAALVGGAVEIAKVSVVPIINAHARGIPFTIAYPDKVHVTGVATDSSLSVPMGSPVQTGQDLNGKTIGVAAIKDANWIAARVWQDANGGDSATSHYIELPFAAVIGAFEAGRVDAAMLADPYLTQGIKGSKCRPLGDPMASFGPRNLETAWVVMRDFATQKRDVVTRFVRVIREAQVWCNAHPAEASAITATFTGIPPAVLATMHTYFATETEPRYVQPWITACAKYEIITKAFDAAELFLNV